MDEMEELRLHISLGIIATAVSVVAYVQDGFWSILKGLFLLSGGCAFIYVLLSAALTKYEGIGHIGFIKTPEKARRFFYDSSINIYGSNFVVLIIAFIAFNFSDKKPTNFADIGVIYWILGFITTVIVIIFFEYIERKK